jgi:DNA-binding Lrp family transcriptional regulator
MRQANGHRSHSPGSVTDGDSVSERDLELIHALQDSPRETWEKLAVRLGTRACRLSTRWDQLVTAGLAWEVIYPSRRWWHTHQLAFVEVPVTPATAGAVAAEVASDPSVLSVDAGPDAILASIAGRDYTSIGQHLLTGRIHGTTIHWAVQLHTNASFWRTGALPGVGAAAGVPVQGGFPNEARVRQVLRVLGPDPRLPAQQLAAACGVSDWTARVWIQRMLAAEDVSIRCEVVPTAAGRPVAMHWWLRVSDEDTPALVDLLLRRQRQHVRWVVSVDGTTDATMLAALSLPTLQAAHDLHALVARVVPRAVTVRRMYLLRPIKRAGWLIDPATGRRGGYVPLDV